MKNELITKAEKLLENIKICEVASVTEDGYPRICVLMPLKHDGVNTFWFSTATSSKKVQQYKKNNKAGVTFFVGGDSVTLTGKMTIENDKQIKDDLWQDFLAKHFDNGGKNDPEYCIIRFDSIEGTFYIDGDFKTLKI